MSSTKITRRQALIAVGGVAAAAVVGGAALYYGGYIGKPSLGKKEILIGGTLPLTGVSAGDALKFQHGMQMAVDKINADGGVLGATLKLDLLDDAFDVSKVGSLYETLITSHNVDVLVPSYGAPMTIPALAQAEKYNKLMVAGYTSSQQLTQQYGGKCYFSIDTQPSPNYSAWWYKGMSDFLLDFNSWNYQSNVPAPKKIAILNENQFWGIEQHKIWKAAAESQGWQIVVDEFVEMGQMEFSDILTKIRLNNPDVVFAEFFYFRAVPFVKQMYEQGIKTNFLAVSESGTGGAWCDPQQGVGPGLGNGVITFAYVPKTYHDGLSDYLRTENQRLYNSPASFLEATGFAQVEVIADGIKRAGSVSSDALRQSLLNMATPYYSCYTPVKFDSEGTNTLFAPPVGQWINSNIEIVYPLNQATAKPIYPYTPHA